MYADTEDLEGLKTLPFTKRVFGHSLCILELVYQKHSAGYSLGGRTNMSKAPKSLFLSYSACLGTGRFFLAITCFVLSDILLNKVAAFAGPSLDLWLLEWW